MTKVDAAIDNITKANIVLHNLINIQENHFQITETEDIENNSELVNSGHIASNNYSKNAKQIKNDYKEFFNSEAGGVSWQNDIITRTD